MDGGGRKPIAQADAAGPVGLYCMAALVAEEAARLGFTGFSKSLERTLDELLGSLSRDEQRRALRLSFELAVADTLDEQASQPRLRLVYSRDM